VTEQRSPTPYSFILPDATGTRLLLLREGAGWALPRVEFAGGWFAEDVGALARLARGRLGAEVSVLRHLVDDEHQVGELENHNPTWTPPPGARWVDGEALAGLSLAFAEHRATMERWLAEATSGHVHPLRAPWERPGWLAAARAWIEEQAARLGTPLAGPIEQRKAAWGGSSILRAPAAGGDLWFKAVYHRPPSEPAVICLLAERWPANVPRILAADHGRRWMLMADFGDGTIEGRPPQVWDAAVRLFGRIQRETAGEIDRWLALGCADRRPAMLPAELRALLADRDALLGVERGMEVDDIARMESLLPRVEVLCAELDDCHIPPAMVQQDFRHANLVATGDTFCYFDWADTVVAHPFMSGNRFLDYLAPPEGVDRHDWRLAHPDDKERRRLRDAYLEAWADDAPPERLHHAFTLTRRLNPLFQATRWHAERAYIEPGAPWARELALAPSPYLKGFFTDLARDA